METASSFDRLVSEISQDERILLLKKLESISSDPAAQNLESAVDPLDDGNPDITARLKTEPLILRIFLFLKSLFTSADIESVYNDFLVSVAAKAFQKNNEGLLDYKRGLLLPAFYAKLQTLKQAADFFKPAISVYEENQGQFYVFLGSLVVPTLTGQMEKDVSPYSLPLDREVTGELRSSFLRKLEEILQSIPPDDKGYLYSSVRAIEWLKHFVHLPFERLLSRFFSITGTDSTCPIDTAGNDLAAFAKVLCNGPRLFTEIFEAMYFFSIQPQTETTPPQPENPEQLKEAASDYLKKSMDEIAIIKSFITTVPLKQLTGIALHSSVWQNEKLDGAEEWFVKYKSAWRKLFDKEWAEWLKEKQREQTRRRITQLLGIPTYPVLPNRPWQQIWGGIPFSHELTAGFLNTFTEVKYPEFNRLLKILMIEGDFYQHETRIEFTDAYNEFNHIATSIQAYNEKLSDKGNWGTSFATVSKESLRTIQGQAKIDSLMRSIEAESAALLARFGENARTLQLTVAGILTENRNARYDSISNISTIQGKSNAKFRDDLQTMKKCLIETLDIIKELEVIELAVQRK